MRAENYNQINIILLIKHYQITAIQMIDYQLYIISVTQETSMSTKEHHILQGEKM